MTKMKTMTSLHRKLLVSLPLLPLSASLALGSLVEWTNFDEIGSSEEFPATFVETGVVAGNLAGPGLNLQGNPVSNVRLRVNGFINPEVFGFTLTADTGYTVTLESMDFQWWMNNSDDVGKGVASNDTNTDTLEFVNITSPSTTSPTTAQNAIYDFSDIVLNGGDSATFTFTLSEADSNPGDVMLFDNFMVNGTAVIPEPETYALLASLLSLGIVVVLRRKRR